MCIWGWTNPAQGKEKKKLTHGDEIGDQREFNLFVCQAEDVEFKFFCTRILLYTFSERYYLGVEFSLSLSCS